MGFFVNGMLGGYGALMSELYPTAARATAQNVLFNIGRARRRLWPGGRGRDRRVLRLRHRDRVAGGAVCTRHPGAVAADPRAARRGAGVSKKRVVSASHDRGGDPAAGPPSVVAELAEVVANDPVNAEYRHLVARCSDAAASARARPVLPTAVSRSPPASTRSCAGR